MKNKQMHIKLLALKNL